MKRARAGITIAMAGALALTACNDSGFLPDGNGTSATAEGVYAGTLTGSPSGATAFTAVVLADGSYWTFYGQADPALFSVEGFARGSGISDGGEFIADTGVDYGFTPPQEATLEAEYDADANTLAGTYSSTAGTTTFAGGPLTNSSYEYGAAAELALLTGSWDLPGTDGTTYTLDIDADGNFDFMEQGGGGCTGIGAFTAHSSGRNLYSVLLTFDDVPECALPDTTVGGIALAYPITGQDAIQLVAAVTDDQETFGLGLSGTVPVP